MDQVLKNQRIGEISLVMSPLTYLNLNWVTYDALSSIIIVRVYEVYYDDKFWGIWCIVFNYYYDGWQILPYTFSIGFKKSINFKLIRKV